jgi:predicted TIM-barrel enzyme
MKERGSVYPGSFLSTFGQARPILAMLHLKGDTPADRLDRAKREIDTLWACGVDAVVVENYFGDRDDVVAVCDYLRSDARDVVFGVNVLGDDWNAFSIANEFGARFVQLDSVAGHLPEGQDHDFAARLAEERSATSACVLGGVRFKYQPHLSGRPLEEDLLLGLARCDGIVVTGEGTGRQTPLPKIVEFRGIVGAVVPLIVGAGVTPQNCAEQLAVADAVIVGSYIKDTHTADGDVNENHALEFVQAVRALE